MLEWGRDPRRGEAWWIGSDGTWWWQSSDGKWYRPETKPDIGEVPHRRPQWAERAQPMADRRRRRLVDTCMLLFGSFLAGVAGPGLLAASALREEWSPTPESVVVAILSIIVGLATAVAAVERLGRSPGDS